MIAPSNTQIGSTRVNSNPAKWRGLLARYRRLYNPDDNDGARPSVPHPGDVLYWVACVGAVCALLFVATK
jgi:hypothetical protein